MTDSEVSAFYRRLQNKAVKGNELEELPDMQPLVQGVLYRNSLAWMVGPSGHGKTFLGIDIAASVAEGIPWHGRETVRGKVLYVIAEPGKLKTRVRAWKDEHAADMEGVTFFPEAIPICEKPQRQALIKFAKNLDPVLIVFDTQARMTLGMEENSAKEMGQFVAALDEIREATGACVLTVHHPDKSGTGMRGSNATLGAAQTVIEVQKQGLTVEATFPKQKDDEDDICLKFQLVPSQGTLVPRPETRKTLKSHKRVSEPYPPVGGRASETSVNTRKKNSVSSLTRKKAGVETSVNYMAVNYIQQNPGCTWQEVRDATGASRATYYRVLQALKKVKSDAPQTQAQEEALSSESSIPRSPLPRSGNGKVPLRSVHSKTADRAEPAKRVRGPRRTQKPTADQLTPDLTPSKGRSLRRREKPSQRATDTNEPVDEMAEYLQAQKSRPKKYVHPGEKLFGNRYAATARF